MGKVTMFSLNNTHTDAEWFLRGGYETADGFEVK
jgi:hypothetical protein